MHVWSQWSIQYWSCLSTLFNHFFNVCVCVAGVLREKWDRTQHHHWEETGPSASWCHRGNNPSLWQWPSDSRAAVVSPLDLWEPPVRLWVDSHSGCTFQWGVHYFREPIWDSNFEIWLMSRSVLSLTLCLYLQNVLRGCSVLLGPASAALWRGQSSGQSGAAGLADLLEQYSRILAQNMKQTYLNPVALVASNIGQHQCTTNTYTYIQ